jgi:predicted TIM-barrel fold metal-dependent hydrolase
VLIVDAQVHIWSSGERTNPNHRQVAAVSKDDLLIAAREEATP